MVVRGAAVHGHEHVAVHDAGLAAGESGKGASASSPVAFCGQRHAHAAVFTLERLRLQLVRLRLDEHRVRVAHRGHQPVAGAILQLLVVGHAVM